MQLKDKKSLQLFWCLFVIYTSNIIGKTSFSAATVALIDDSILTKTQAGFISGAFWIIYAVGQLIGGFVVNKLSAYTLLCVSITGSTLSNLLMAGSNGFLPMLLLWSLAAATQFGMWPAVLKLVSVEIVPKQRMMVMGRLAFYYCLGSILSYIFTAGLLKMVSWRYIFVFCGVVNLVMLLPCLYARWKLSPILETKDVRENINNSKSAKITWNLVWRSGLIFFCMMMIIKSIVDTGIKNWMPTIMMETYGANPSYTSLLSVILLGTNIFGVLISQFVYDKTKSDELKTLIVLYAAILPMIMALLGFESMNILIATIFMSLITMFVYGSGQILQMNYAGRFNRYGLTATIGGIINCFAAFGNMIATYGGGYIADSFGWKTMIIVWNMLILLFVVIAVSTLPIWRKFRRKI